MKYTIDTRWVNDLGVMLANHYGMIRRDMGKGTKKRIKGDVLAGMLGVTRQGVHHIRRELCKKGYIRVREDGNNRIWIDLKKREEQIADFQKKKGITNE